MSHKAWFELHGGQALKSSTDIRAQEVEVPFDLLIGADGAHSAARYHLMKYTRMDYQQDYIDTLWCEFQIPASESQVNNSTNSRFRISPNHLHIWPGKEFMFIAIPSCVRQSIPYSPSDLIKFRMGHLSAPSSFLPDTLRFSKKLPRPYHPSSIPTFPE